MPNKRIYIFVGTTAELIKLAPVIRELNRRKIKYTIIASGQNDIHFEEFRPLIGYPHILRAVNPKGSESSVFKFLVWTVRTFFSLLKGMRSNFSGLDKSNSLFIVHGDTVSSLMGSLVAAVYGLKLVHIESGLRSFNFLEPFPEEICRFIVSRIADVHFCPNQWCMNNLRGVKGDKINTRQNTLIESFWFAMDHTIRSHKRKEPYFILVAHRQEHVLFNRVKTKKMLRFVLNTAPANLRCLFLVHDISAAFVHSLENLIPVDVADNIIKVDRMPYRDFMQLLAGSEFLITDGGSNQEEMYYMGKPCLLLRSYTERREGLGKNVLLSKYDNDKIRSFLTHYKDYRRFPVRSGKRPSEIIIDYLFHREVK